MDTQKINDIASKAADRGEAFELIAGESESISVSWEDGAISDNSQRVSGGVGLSIAKNGKLGFTNHSSLDKPDALIDSAALLAEHGAIFDYSFAPKAESDTPEVYDEKLSELDAEYLFGLCDHAKGRLDKEAPDALFSASAGISSGGSTLITSEGQEIEERFAGMHFMVAPSIKQEGDFLQVYDSQSSNRVMTIDEVDSVIDHALVDFNAGRKSAKIGEGTYRVLLTPYALQDALTPIVACANGTNVEKQISRWKDSIGEQVFDSQITIWDDPTHADGPGSSRYDGEGMPTLRRPIIEEGVLRSFAHSRASAARCGVPATGNASRSVRSKPSPSFHNVIMEGGEKSVSELMEEANGGLMIRRLIGVFTSNFLAGQVSGNVMTGFKVDGGERAGRVKNCAINFNLFDAFNGKIVGISKEREWVGSYLLPSVLIENVAVSAG